MSRTYIMVHKDRALVYSDTDPHGGRRIIFVTVLAVDVIRGGDPLLLSRVVPARTDDLRSATIADFGRFRVSPRGYLESDRYVFDKTGEDQP